MSLLFEPVFDLQSPGSLHCSGLPSVCTLFDLGKGLCISQVCGEKIHKLPMVVGFGFSTAFDGREMGTRQGKECLLYLFIISDVGDETLAKFDITPAVFKQ